MNLKTDETAARPASEELKKQWNQISKKKGFLWFGVLGIALLLILSFFTDGSTQKAQSQTTGAAEELEVSEYEKALETRLAELISHVEGVGDVTVMVTLENTSQAVYAQAQQGSSDVSSNQQNEISERSSYSNDYVLIEQQDGTYALTETTLQPTIKGVAVVCTGAEDIRVVSRVTELISTVLGITSNRICVTK